MTAAVKRIMNKDMKMIHKMNLESLGIYIQFDEENVLKARAMIIGPPGTPFENGVLFFLIDFPNNYPYSPPKVIFLIVAIAFIQIFMLVNQETIIWVKFVYQLLILGLVLNGRL